MLRREAKIRHMPIGKFTAWCSNPGPTDSALIQRITAVLGITAKKSEKGIVLWLDHSRIVGSQTASRLQKNYQEH